MTPKDQNSPEAILVEKIQMKFLGVCDPLLHPRNWQMIWTCSVTSFVPETYL
jgi:hypothetical protein